MGATNASVIPSHDELRRWMFAETDRLRTLFRWALEPDRSNRFSWSGIELWVDRVRTMALSAATARQLECYESDSVPASAERELEFRGVRSSTVKPRRLLGVLAAHLTQRSDEVTNGPLWAEYVNFTVAQAYANPAFESLCWLALQVEFEQRLDHSDLGDLVAPLTLDLAQLPFVRPPARTVRAAQVAFVHQYLSPSIDSEQWLEANDDAWAGHCRAILEANGIESVVAELYDVAGRQIVDADRGYV